jgi:hypothetical protein
MGHQTLVRNPKEVVVAEATDRAGVINLQMMKMLNFREP